MPITFSFTSRSFAKSARDFAGSCVGKVLDKLREVGDECVSEARLSGSYQDRTGNLRGSIGYVVAYNGEVVSEGGFLQVGAGTDGPGTGRALAHQKALESGTGAVLILVAGMSYARLVADKGFNVLDSADLLAERLIARL